jgi:hypothetical protein
MRIQYTRINAAQVVPGEDVLWHMLILEIAISLLAEAPERTCLCPALALFVEGGMNHRFTQMNTDKNGFFVCLWDGYMGGTLLNRGVV